MTTTQFIGAARLLTRILGAILLLNAGLAAQAAGILEITGATDRPNILLLVADDLGYSDLGAYGSEIATPSLDALAESGVSFTNFHAAPTCSPTRAMLLTGVDHHLAGLGNMKELMAENQAGQPGYEGHLNERVVTVARLLRDSGYRTYMAGKWHLGRGPGLLPRDRGFERTFAMLEGSGNHFSNKGILPFRSTSFVSNGEPVERPDGYSTDLFTDKLIEILEADRGDGRPFFAYAAYTAPHWPLQAPDEDIEPYEDAYQSGWDELRARRFEQMKRLGLIREELTLPPHWPGVPTWDSLTPEEQRIQARKMAVYAAMVTNMDRNIGRLIAYLRRSGQLDNTLIVFLSDNGADGADLETRLPAGMSRLQLSVYRTWLWLKFDNSLANLGREDSFFSYGLPWAEVGSTPLFLYKGVVSEGGTRVPLIMSFPGKIPAATRSEALCSVMDLPAAFLELAGVSHPGNRYGERDIHPIQGRSLMPLAEGRSENVYADDRPLGFELIGNGALIRGDWKIMRINEHFSDGKWRLFNLKDDPRELRDLSKQNPDRLAEMQRLYRTYAEEHGVIELPPDYFDNW